MAATRKDNKAKKESYPRRGEIYLTALDPTVGQEVQKTRPALIIQNDISNRLSQITVVAPITSTGLLVTSVAVFNQIRAVDRVRLLERLGAVTNETMEEVDEAIKVSLGLQKF